MYLEKTHAPQNAKPERNTHLHLSINLDDVYGVGTIFLPRKKKKKMHVSQKYPHICVQATAYMNTIKPKITLLTKT